MELLNTVKKKPMLESGIEDLHRESTSWYNAICFWEDECLFYTDLVNNKLFQFVTQKEKGNIISLLEKIIGNKLVDLKMSISLHEKNLAELIRKKSETTDYRQKHKQLSKKFDDYSEQMKLFKKAVFELFQLVNTNFFNGNETLHIIQERRSVRNYKKDSIDKIHIEQIISAGRMAPSAMNVQPWKFYVVTNTAKLKLYSTEICKITDDVLKLSLKKLQKESDPVFHGAPVAIFITSPKGDQWASFDIGMCAQNMMLAARSMGYDTCPVVLVKALEKTPYYKELRIPEDEEIKLAVVVGYANEKPSVPARKLNNIIFVN